MISNKNILYRLLLALVLFSPYKITATAQSHIISDPVKLDKLKKAVEAHPEDFEAHWAYIRARDFDSPELLSQYDEWVKKYPKLAVVPYAIGEALSRRVHVRARDFLLKAVALNPNYAEAWHALASEAVLRGDFGDQRTYLGKATVAAPDNADYAFSYVYSFSSVDPAKYKQMSIDFVHKFPKHQRAAQALYWLANKTDDVNEKIKYYNWIRNSYPAAEYDWGGSGMRDYFNLLLFSDPAKAVDLAVEMNKQKKAENEWVSLIEIAKAVNTAKGLMDEKKNSAALKTLNTLKLPKFFPPRMELLLWKARVQDLSGQTNAAYDSLMIAFSKSPSPGVKTELISYGTKLGKSNADVNSDIWKQIEAISKAATEFKLKNYLTSGYTSLADYKGKVVFITYWYPGCGPCRGEFPHFENVVRKFRGQDLAYFGINIYSKQNNFVIPFVQKSGYSFVPLEDVDGREKGNLDNGHVAPVNFLIDKEGRVVFANFRTDGSNEDELEMMIEMLLNKKG